jgi:hypothetical protein
MRDMSPDWEPGEELASSQEGGYSRRDGTEAPSREEILRIPQHYLHILTLRDGISMAPKRESFEGPDHKRAWTIQIAYLGTSPRAIRGTRC